MRQWLSTHNSMTRKDLKLRGNAIPNKPATKHTANHIIKLLPCSTHDG